MLILTRRIGESIVIGDTVTVTVLRIKRNSVRVGVNAPRALSIQREEFYGRIKEEPTAPVASVDSTVSSSQ